MIKRNRRGSALLSLLITLAIIGLIYYFATKNNKKAAADTSTKSFIRDAGVDTSSYKHTLDSTKKIIKDAEATRVDVP